MFRNLVYSIFLFSITVSAGEAEDLYKANCMACHALDKMVVGPSLVEIGHLYKENPAGIVRWSLNPQVKRKLAIRMPPMTHLGKDKLRIIADYILKETKGKRYKPEKPPIDQYAKAKVPLLQRMFMPYASPAAIAISAGNGVFVCWDAGTCQFRYAWNGKEIDQWPVWQGNGNALAVIRGSIFTQIESGNPIDQNFKFKGYRLVDQEYELQYEIKGIDFRSKFRAQSKNKLEMHISTNANKAITYTPNIIKGKWTCNKGSIKDGILNLTKDQAQNFKITFQSEEE